MLKKGILFLLVSLTAIFLVACNEKEESEPVTKAPEVSLLEAELTVNEKAAVGETVKLKTVVTQGDDMIDDASEVNYEVWEEGDKSNSVIIDAKNEGEGVYTAETSFDHDGLFHIQVHVTANDQHTMPVVEVTVGEGGNYEEAGDDEKNGFVMHFNNPEEAVIGDEVNLVVHLEIDGEPLEAANVQYEIWDETTEEAHDWIDADELTAGEYGTLHTFEEAGTYQVQVHVKSDDGLHEHEAYEIDVK